MLHIAYLIIAHKNPLLIKRVVDRLSSNECGFFIHIDQKSDLGPFSAITGRNVTFLRDRVEVYWAEYTQVEATLRLIRAALRAHVRYDYLILLSGSDYPLRSKDYIHAYFERHRGAEFIGMRRIPSAEAGVPLSRIRTVRYPSTMPTRKLVFRVLAKIGLGQRDYRRHLGVPEAYGGSTWWALTNAACHHIIDVAQQNRTFCRYFERTSASDEMFFHTILGNSRFKGHIRRNVMYDDWINVPSHSPHPALLTEKHLEQFEAEREVSCPDAFGPGEMLFARKFSDRTLELLSRLDRMIDTKDGALSRVTLNSSGGTRE